MMAGQNKSGPGGAGNTVTPGLTPAKEGLMPDSTHVPDGDPVTHQPCPICEQIACWWLVKGGDFLTTGRYACPAHHIWQVEWGTSLDLPGGGL